MMYNDGFTSLRRFHNDSSNHNPLVPNLCAHTKFRSFTCEFEASTSSFRWILWGMESTKEAQFRRKSEEEKRSK